MDSETFVETLRTVVEHASVDDVVSTLEHPPGRRPEASLVALSTWYLALDEPSRARVRQVLKLVSHAAVFGVLAVLDGSRAVDGPGAKGSFELVHVAPDGSRAKLGNLHELF